MNVKVRNLNRKKKNYKKNQMETLELKAKENSLERFNSRMEMTERTSELEESSIEIISTEEQREKTVGEKMKLRDLWDNIKLYNICGTPREGSKKMLKK